MSNGKRMSNQKSMRVKASVGLLVKQKKPSVLPAQSAWRAVMPGCTYQRLGLKTERKSALKPSSAKAKGRVLQQAVRDLILAKFNLEQDDVRSVSMGATGEDLLLSPAARRQLPISLECKSRASISVYGFYEQAKANAGGYEPVVVVKQNRDKPLVVVDCVYFFELLRRASNE